MCEHGLFYGEWHGNFVHVCCGFCNAITETIDTQDPALACEPEPWPTESQMQSDSLAA